MTNHHHLEQKLEEVERLARGSILGRFLHNPRRYVSAIGFWRLVYPLTKQGKYITAQTFFGAKMDLILPSATEIYLFGAKTHDSELRLARFLMKNLKAGDTFCDVGAHFGYFSLLASLMVGENGRVLAFEASQSTFDILQQNLRPYPNAVPLHRAASSANAPMTFYEFPPLYSEYNTLMPNADADWMKTHSCRSVDVQAVRLADYFQDENIRPAIIKIDVEGAEPYVLEGLKPYLLANSPIIVMEYLLSSRQNMAHQAAADFLKDLGYQAYTIENDGGLDPCADILAAMLLVGLDSDNIVFLR